MLEMIRHEALLAPITFLYATDSKFLSSTVNSTAILATSFIASFISTIEVQGYELLQDFRNEGFLGAKSSISFCLFLESAPLS